VQRICLATIGRIRIQTHRLVKGIMMYTVEMCSDAMMCARSFIKIGLGIQQLGGGGEVDLQTAWRLHKLTLGKQA
jgi:hypothetical protein